VKAVREFAGRLAGVHLKDWTPAYGRYSHRYAEGFVSLGKGKVNLKGYLKELDDIQFNDWVVVEQDPSTSTPARGAWECAEWLANEGRMTIGDRGQIKELCSREARAVRQLQCSDVVKRETQFLRAVLPSTIRGFSNFYQTVTDAIMALGAMPLRNSLLDGQKFIL